MSAEPTPLNAEDNAAVDMLLQIGDVHSWDMSWDLDTELMSVLDVVVDTERDDNPNRVHDLVLHDFNFDEDENIDWGASEQDLIEPIPQSSNVEDCYLAVETELAQLDGEQAIETGPETETKTATNTDTPLKSTAELMAGPGCLDASWSVVSPLSTSSTVEVLRLCFARVSGNEYRIYDALDDVGYHHWGEPLLISGIRGLHDGVQLADGYVHIFAETELPEHVKQMIQDETGADIAELLNNSDCLYGIDIVPDSEQDIMCVGRRERVVIDICSQTVAGDQKSSGTNIFGEATRIALTISKTEIVLDNEAIVQMSHEPETNVFFYASSNNIYVLNGRILFEHTELGKHVLPISNIDLTPISPPHAVTVNWDVKDL